MKKASQTCRREEDSQAFCETLPKIAPAQEDDATTATSCSGSPGEAPYDAAYEGAPHGASDHGVSEAIYLKDPDGNGLELYWDRPKEIWPRAEDGALAMFFKKVMLIHGDEAVPSLAFII